jgi:BirA family biotin operon repressor/biotin-[acetyl-CoA-carboxylase] ligase
LPYLPFHKSHKLIGTPFIELQKIDSTNNYALRQIHAGLAQHGLAVFAHKQMEGKGQRGKIWSSDNDSNMALSIAIKPAPLTIAQQFQLSACIAVAVQEFFRKYAGIDTRIKWPNDLYWKDRKAGGILIENVIGGQKPEVRGQKPEKSTWQWAVIGIGININQTAFPPELPNAVSLKQITGESSNPIELAKELCNIIDNYFHELITKGFENILSIYLSHFYKRDKKVKLKKDNRIFDAVIKGISSTGKLIVQHGIEEEFGVGEVEWVIS